MQLLKSRFLYKRLQCRLNHYYYYMEGIKTKICWQRADITKLKVDAIVNAANNTLLGGGGVDGAIHRAAGKQLVKECKDLGGCRTGEAKITGGYNLPSKYVIHTVGPIGENGTALHACYTNSLELLYQNGLKSIAFPCISTGIYGYPNDTAAEVALSAVQTWLTQHPNAIDTVLFCLFLDVDVVIYTDLLKEFFKGMKDFEGKVEVVVTKPKNKNPDKNKTSICSTFFSPSTSQGTPVDVQETHKYKQRSSSIGVVDEPKKNQRFPSSHKHKDGNEQKAKRPNMETKKSKENRADKNVSKGKVGNEQKAKKQNFEMKKSKESCDEDVPVKDYVTEEKHAKEKVASEAKENLKAKNGEDKISKSQEIAVNKANAEVSSGCGKKQENGANKTEKMEMEVSDAMKKNGEEVKNETVVKANAEVSSDSEKRQEKGESNKMEVSDTVQEKDEGPQPKKDPAAKTGDKGKKDDEVSSVCDKGQEKGASDEMEVNDAVQENDEGPQQEKGPLIETGNKKKKETDKVQHDELMPADEAEDKVHESDKK
uniref:O-acetyl-ADP-ribose deacetylase MACROD2 n=1 Tax=Ciona intestinalis TaxID=7719 RepID=UPI000180CC3E|nr:O-acetyl-ADP-ribose deacetylase MACROD2 [Ciona intestinalis]|eukprot:XP_002129874.1 O-acetyl-ADP-ribose deacetylase MACROD2 [Ciona intestinalis]